MMVSAVVYASSTGFTARYAQMIAQRAGLPACRLGDGGAPPPGTAALYLGWLCAGGIKGLKKARRRYDLRAVCAVGMAPAQENYTAKIRRENSLEALPFFYLRGGYAPERLTGLYKLMMAPVSKMVSKAPAEDESAIEMREAMLHGGDWVNEVYLDPVLAWLGLA